MIDLRHVKLKGFATVVEEGGLLKVNFINEQGEEIHAEPLVFSGLLPHERAHKTTVNGKSIYFLDDLLVVFDEEWFSKFKEKIPPLGKWENAVRLNVVANMDPKHEPKPILGQMNFSAEEKDPSEKPQDDGDPKHPPKETPQGGDPKHEPKGEGKEKDPVEKPQGDPKHEPKKEPKDTDKP